MPNIKRASLLVGTALTLFAGAIPAAGAAPAPTVLGAVTPVAGCTVTPAVPYDPGPPEVLAAPEMVDCTFWATTGTMTLPDLSVVPTWGFTDVDPLSGGVAQVPGPTIVASEGAVVTVTLNNALTVDTGMLFSGIDMIPDLTGVAPSGTTTYSFTADRAGTFLYEAAPLPGWENQVAMGMYGALVVNPATPGTWTDEFVVMLSEVDPALNNSVDPMGFDMRAFDAAYGLINGQAAPVTPDLVTTAVPGDDVLLRYLNAGTEPHSMGLLGLDQSVMARDGHALTYTRSTLVERVSPGGTTDAVVALPLGAAGKYPLYDTGYGDGTDAFGGMLTHLDAGGTPVVGAGGPAMTIIGLAASYTDPGADPQAEVQVNVTPEAGFDWWVDGGPIASVGQGGSAFVDLTPGNHVFYAAAVDATTGARTVVSQDFYVDRTGPDAYGIMVIPEPTLGNTQPVFNNELWPEEPRNAGEQVWIQATADDRLTGGSAIMAARYGVGAIPTVEDNGTCNPAIVCTDLALISDLPTMAIQGVGGWVPAADLSATGDTVYVQAQDAQGHWGPWSSAAVVTDDTGPIAGLVNVNPDMTNLTQVLNPSRPVVRISSALDDALSPVIHAEAFIVGTPVAGVDPALFAAPTPADYGTGFPLTPVDGRFDEQMESVYGDIPLPTLALLADGSHEIWIHGVDSAGQWGGFGTGTLTMDVQPPTASVTADGATTPGSLVITGTFVDAVTNIAVAEWWIGADPGIGNGNAFDTSLSGSLSETLTATLSTSCWVAGSVTVSARAQDSSGNWSAVASTAVTPDRGTALFSDDFSKATLLDTWDQVISDGTNPTLNTTNQNLEVAAGGWGYVLNGCPSSEPTYSAAFDVTVTHNGNHGWTSLMWLVDSTTSTPRTIAQVQYRMISANRVRFRALVRRPAGSGWYRTAVRTVTATGNHAVTLDYDSGYVALSVDGVPATLQAGVPGSATFVVDDARLGRNRNRTSDLVIDNFVSTR